MKDVLYLIPAILNRLLINVLSKSKKNIISALFYSHQCVQGTLSAILSIHHTKVFYTMEFVVDACHLELSQKREPVYPMFNHYAKMQYYLESIHTMALYQIKIIIITKSFFFLIANMTTPGWFLRSANATYWKARKLLLDVDVIIEWRFRAQIHHSCTLVYTLCKSSLGMYSCVPGIAIQ